MSQPVLGILDPYFLQIMDEDLTGLLELFNTRNHLTFPIAASGSGALECAIANFVPAGSKLAVVAAGHFADRISIIAGRHRAKVVLLE
jgi:aspartate aminotransferase-like enzyme